LATPEETEAIVGDGRSDIWVETAGDNETLATALPSNCGQSTTSALMSWITTFLALTE
jgi:hypothetical protein